MEDTPLKFDEELALIASTARAIREAQDVILERPWLAPMFSRLLPEQAITERTFAAFVAEGSLGLSKFALECLNPSDDATPTA